MKKRKKPLGYNKRSEEQRIYDIRFCADLFLRGYSYREIADALNRDLSARGMGYTITFQMVYYDLQQCLIEWKRERLESIDEYVTQELRKLDKMEQQAWEAWEASKTGKMRTKEKTNKGRPIKTDAEDGDPEYYGYNETATETSAGNPRFLDLLLNIQQRRAKMRYPDITPRPTTTNQSTTLKQSRTIYCLHWRTNYNPPNTKRH